jgi:hypothetical protein
MHDQYLSDCLLLPASSTAFSTSFLRPYQGNLSQLTSSDSTGNVIPWYQHFHGDAAWSKSYATLYVYKIEGFEVGPSGPVGKGEGLVKVSGMDTTSRWVTTKS